MRQGKFNLLVLVLIVVAAVLSGIVLLSHVMGPAPDRDYRGWTRGQLKETTALFSLYYSDTNEWPDIETWETQIKNHFPKLEDYATYRSKGGLFIDLWGNEIRYKVDVNENKTERILYSLGRNKKDEGGKGDDIVQIVK